MAAILELLGRQRQKRVGDASDELAVAARQHAAGKSVDLAAVDRALAELGMPLEHFDELCRIAAVRRDAGAALEKLGSATTKQQRLDESMAAERHKFDEYRAGFVSRMTALEAQKAAVDAVVASGHTARQTLLVPSNVLGSLRTRYEETLAERQSSAEAVEQIQRELRQHRSKLAEAGRWIASIMQSVDREIQPTGLLKQAKQVPPSVARQLEPHELDIKRAQRRIDEAEAKLRDAEERHDRAERSVVAVETLILKE